MTNVLCSICLLLQNYQLNKSSSAAAATTQVTCPSASVVLNHLADSLAFIVEKNRDATESDKKQRQQFWSKHICLVVATNGGSVASNCFGPKASSGLFSDPVEKCEQITTNKS